MGSGASQQASGQCGWPTAGGPLSSACRALSTAFVLHSGFSSRFPENGTPRGDPQSRHENV